MATNPFNALGLGLKRILRMKSYIGSILISYPSINIIVASPTFAAFKVKVPVAVSTGTVAVPA
jgi:hypothetical protein